VTFQSSGFGRARHRSTPGPDLSGRGLKGRLVGQVVEIEHLGLRLADGTRNRRDELGTATAFADRACRSTLGVEIPMTGRGLVGG
jgi:hypothetical protein